MASASWGLLGGLLLLVAQPAPAESVFVPPLDVGVYDDAGDYTPLRRDHTAGAYPPFYRLRSFLAFDLSRVSGNVTGAKLHLRFSGYFGDDGETIALHEVTTPVAELVAGGTGLVPVFDDLADGLLLGSKEVLRTQVAFVTHEIPLTPAALPLLQAALGGDFALGASVASLSGHAREQLSGCCLTLARLLELEGDLEVEPWPPPAHFGPHFAVIDFEFGVNTLPDDIPGVTFVSTPSTAPEPWFGGTASWGGRIFGAQHFGNLYSGDYSDLGIEFSPPVRSVGGWVRNVPAHSDEARSVETLRVSAWASSGQLLEERIVDLPAADAPPIFVDFTSPGGIARIEWSSDDVGRFGVEDVVYSGFAAAVPALGPGAHVLMMLSLVLAGALHAGGEDSVLEENVASGNLVNGFSIDDFSSVAGPGPAVGNLSEENEADGNGGLADPFANVGFGFFVGVFFQPDADLVDANEFGDNRCAKNATGASNPSGVCDTGDDDD